MKTHEDTGKALARWKRTFRAAAKLDDYQVFRKHLRALDLPDDPHLLLDGTLRVVEMCVAYLALDNQRVSEFLEQQTYGPSKSTDSLYQMTMDIHGRAYARVNVSASLQLVDLADLYGTPWNQYRVVGYCDLWLSRVDGDPLSPKECSDLEKEIEYDLRFDYCEDEVRFWFDPDTHPGVLKVHVQDVLEGEDDDGGPVDIEEVSGDAARNEVC